MTFIRRNLEHAPKTLGEKFRAIRCAKAISLEMVERQTRIQRTYLLALESGAYEKLPAPLYTKNFVRTYATFLGADNEYFVDLYQEECGRCDLVDPMRMPRQRLKKTRLFVWNNILKFTFAGSLAIVVFGYFGLQLRSIIAPPDVIIFSPVDESMTAEAIAKVEGIVEKESTVFINGEQVVINEDHTFQKNVDLNKGLNIITIEAERRYSKQTRIERRVLFDPSEFSYILDN